MAFTGQLGPVLGPLTTAWTVPDECKINVLGCATCNVGWRAQTCVTGKASDHGGCWPPVTEKAGTRRSPFLGRGFYSPGLVCPNGYRTACTAEHGGRSEWEVQFNLVAGETAVGCCPEYVYPSHLKSNSDGKTFD